MNYLQKVQALQEESGSGSSQISTVVGVTGEILRLKNWIDTADLTIQSQYVDWKFLWREGAPIVTGIGSSDYVGPENLNVWDFESLKIDGQKLSDVQYYETENFPTSASAGRPTSVFVLPNNRLRLYPTPDAAYTITADYWAVPQSMKLTTPQDTAQSVIPSQFHRVVIYTALQMLAKWENAPELANLAQDGIEQWYPKLEAHQLPGQHQMGTRADGNFFTIVTE